MAFPKKIKLPVATSNRSQHDLSCQHITTSDFMTFNVAKAMELVPNQSVNIQMQTFARLEPLAVPTFGRALIKNRAYFVPFRTVWTAWNDFITDVPHIYDNGEMSQVSTVPTVNTNALSRIFLDDAYSTEVQSTSAYDFDYITYTGSSSNNISNHSYGKFTALGRHTYKLLRSLGYTVDFTSRNHAVSALPLLALCRVYFDYYYPSQYSSDEESAWLQSFFQNNGTVGTGGYFFTLDDLIRMFKVVTKVSYDTDYFTSAWDNPNAPNSGLASSVVINDINNPDHDIVYDGLQGVTTAPVIASESAGTIERLSQFALNALRSLSDYLKRNQISGSRVIDRYLARFGVKLRNEQLNRSVYLGEYLQDIKFGDVISSASTEDATLGAYAGRGVSFGNGNFSFDADEYGMMIIVSTIIPETQYYQGENRHCNHLSKLDFFTPEFDNLGTQAMACTELYVPTGGMPPTYRDKVFGFTPRYAEYKVPHSQITGDFIVRSLNTGKDAWTLFRDVSPFVNEVGIDNLEHSITFVEGQDSEQYNRIFTYVGTDADKINIIHDFNIQSNFPGKSLYDTYEFENEDKAQKTTLELNGTTHN